MPDARRLPQRAACADEQRQGAGVTGSRREQATRRIDVGRPGIPGGQGADLTAVPPEYRRAFSLLAFVTNRFIVDHVIRTARLFENDTEALLLFGMLAHLNIVHLMPPGSTPSTTLDRRGRVPDPQPKLRPVRIRDLAQISGRPRETVRRKLEQMRSAGRVHRLPTGWVFDAAAVDEDMMALTLDGIRRFLQTADIMQSVLKDTAVAIRKDATPPAGSTRRKGKP
jgi:hypothetical protein